MGPPPVPVTLATAGTQAVQQVLQAIGNVEPSATVQVRPQVAGELVRANFAEGQNVRKGDLLFQIDPRPYRDALLQAEAGVAKDRALLAQAEANVSRDQAQLKYADTDAQRRISDHQGRIGHLEHGVQIRRMGSDGGRRAVTALQDDAGQLDGSARTGIGRQSADFLGRAGSDQQDAADGPVTGDSDARDNGQILAGQFEGRHNADVGLAGGDTVGAIGGDLEVEVEEAALRTVKHPPNQRYGIQEAHRADARAGNSGLAQVPV